MSANLIPLVIIFLILLDLFIIYDRPLWHSMVFDDDLLDLIMFIALGGAGCLKDDSST